MASPILITMHPAADRDQMPHGGEHGRGDKNDALAPMAQGLNIHSAVMSFLLNL